MKLHLYTAPARAQYGAESIEHAVEVPDEAAAYFVEVGIGRPAGEAPEPEPEVEEPVEDEPEAVEAPEPEADEAPDYEAMNKAELVEIAEARGIEVVRQDGEDGVPKKSDYIAALSG